MLRDLCKAIPHLKLHAQDKAMLHSALTLAFFGCLRVSEFTHAWDLPTISALKSDVSASRHSVVYHLRHSKTDQYGQGSHIAIGSREEAVCPCKAMLDYLQRSKDHQTAPLYRSCDAISPLINTCSETFYFDFEGSCKLHSKFTRGS